MPVDEMFDVLPQDTVWGHELARDADGLELHYVKRGQGNPTVLLLHGWPGFWYDWRRVLPLQEMGASMIAPFIYMLEYRQSFCFTRLF
jgi:pimeloyl-ACP methyl ester carboxylesterase